MDDLAFPSEAVSGLLELAVAVAIPFLVFYLVQFVRRYLETAQNRMRETDRDLIDRALQIAVKAAEQKGLAGLIPGGEAKKQEAIRIAQGYLGRFGLQIDMGRISDMIEAEVLTQFSQPSSPALAPAQRAQILDKAVELAVLAAEQSGLAGLIQNEGQKKKEFAVRFAERYLKEHGLKVELDVVADMIEAQLIKFLMQARLRLAGAAS
jgi:hypothetical protein